ncbi:MAG: hypothetical protein Q8S13_07910 [Dehalococcoidia bacterium]|nr:hypothetical protein [Dehalococcoidia bacterium]
MNGLGGYLGGRAAKQKAADDAWGARARQLTPATAKRIGSAALGEGLAKRLYPKAKPLPLQYKTGGADFLLPTGAYLEAKNAAVGKKIETTRLQRVQLQRPGSRVVIALYNRQAADVNGGNDPGEWAKYLSHVITAVLDVPGPWLVRLLGTDAGRGSGESIVYLTVEDLLAAVRAQKVCGTVIQRLDWSAAGKDITRYAIPFYLIGRSTFLQLETDRAARDKRMGREEAPF